MPTLFLNKAIESPEDAVTFVRSNNAMEVWDGSSVTTAGDANGLYRGSTAAPVVRRQLLVTTGGGANRVFAPSFQLTGFNVCTKNVWIGGFASVYRTTNGIMSRVRDSLIVGGAIDAWDLSSGGNTRVNGTAFEYQFQDWNGPNVPYWFSVAAIDTSGNIGPRSAAVSFTPTAVSGGADAVNTTSPITHTSTAAALAAPTDLTATQNGTKARVVNLSWAAVAGASGYVVYHAYANPATEIVANPYLDLASDGGGALLAGDVVVLRRKILRLDANMISSRIWGLPGEFSGVNVIMHPHWRGVNGAVTEYVPLSPKPSPTLGEWMMRTTVNAGASAQFERFFHSGTGQSFYETLMPGETLRWEAWMRCSEPATVSLDFTDPELQDRTLSLTTSWQFFQFDDSVSVVQTGSDARGWNFSFTGGSNGRVYEMAGLRCFSTATPYNGISLPIAPQNFIRDHMLIKPGTRCYDADTATDREGDGGREWTLASLYRNCVDKSSSPWIQLEWNLDREDWLNIVAYLAAPTASGHPYALRRAAQGHNRWTDQFSRIVFEFGNEAWNTTPGFWNTPSTVDAGNGTPYNTAHTYGLWCQMIVNWMKESPFWPALAARVEFFAGGWSINQWGRDAAQYFPDCKYVGIASYNGGWDNGTELVAENGTSFAGLLADSHVVQRPRFEARNAELRTLATAQGKTFGVNLVPAIYEAGPGYQLNGLNGVSVTAQQAIEQEVVMKSRACVTSTVDSFLLSALNGYWGANYFTLGRGDRWSSHELTGRGGQEYGAYALTRVMTDVIAPARVKELLTFKATNHNVISQTGSTVSSPSVVVYALQSVETPSRWMLAVVNRRINPSVLNVADPLYQAGVDNSLDIAIRTGWTSATSAVQYANKGNMRQHNRYPVGTRLNTSGGFSADPLCVAFSFAPTSFTFTNPGRIVVSDLRGGECVLLLFDGVVQN